MSHILSSTNEEIHFSLSTLTSLETPSIFSKFFGNGDRNFFELYKNLINIKETFLMKYSSLYSDIRVDKKSSELLPEEIQNISKSFIFITEEIEKFYETLKQFSTKNFRQRKILNREKKFFIQAINSLFQDTQDWSVHHSTEIQNEIIDIEKIQKSHTMEDGNALLELQKKRLTTLQNTINS